MNEDVNIDNNYNKKENLINEIIIFLQEEHMHTGLKQFNEFKYIFAITMKV